MWRRELLENQQEGLSLPTSMVGSRTPTGAGKSVGKQEGLGEGRMGWVGETGGEEEKWVGRLWEG